MKIKYLQNFINIIIMILGKSFLIKKIKKLNYKIYRRCGDVNKKDDE